MLPGPAIPLLNQVLPFEFPRKWLLPFNKPVHCPSLSELQADHLLDWLIWLVHEFFFAEGLDEEIRST